MTDIEDLRGHRVGFNDVADILSQIHGSSTIETGAGFNAPDGKPVYTKTVNFGSLPNATTKSVAHGITNLYDIIDYKGYATDPVSGLHFFLPHSTPTSNQAMALYVDDTYIKIVTGIDRTGFSRCHVTLLYTQS